MGLKTTTRVPAFAGTCCLLMALGTASSAAPPSANDIAAINAAAPTLATRPLRARKILVYTRANGFRHSSIETAGEALTILGKKSGAWSAVVTDDIKAFEDLSPFDAVVFANTTGEVLLPANFNDLDDAAKTSAKANETRYKANLLGFVNAGKGFAGIHAATDTMYGWSEYGQMIGGYFDGHPWNAGDPVTVRVEDDKSPITQGLRGQSLSFNEEIYQFKNPFNRTQQRVLMGLDMSKTAPKNGMKRSDNDFPVTWIKPQGAGRVFYCSLGHNEAMYRSSDVLGVYLAGIQYAIGDLQADATPIAQIPTVYSDAVMGEYALALGAAMTYARALPANFARIISEGGSNYRAALLEKTPEGTTKRVELTGALQDGAVAFVGTDGGVEVKANWKSDALTLTHGANRPMNLRKIARTSPTLGQKAPFGAVALLPFSPEAINQMQGPSLSRWKNQEWIAMRDGSAQVRGGDNRTNQEFGDIQLHLEWMAPLQPDARGQGRGNSGVYLQDRYEVQVLDSFGLDSKDNDAGGIYQIATPLVNASLPPGQWQTYDITFRAPRLYADGTLAKAPVVTVVHNGVVIQKDIEIPRSTGGGIAGFAAKAPIRLQDHGNPVRYRNIWVQELTDQPWTPVDNPAVAGG